MASGVQVSDEVKQLFEDMKVHHKGEDENDHCKIAVMKIREHSIEVEKKYTLGEIKKGNQDPFVVFQNQLKSDTCCYVLYDCCFDTKEVPNKEDLILIMWTPEGGPREDKMVYSTSKQSLKAVCSGVKYNLEMQDYDDICSRHSFGECLGKEVTSIEGISVCKQQRSS
ncbi:cofilin-2-like [Thalassophryne amazonica]|uniref:cofilin-2-like n=1 Tax=Thalassophryne amazonica TaxID=390379 RepID=UPI0014723CDE|nr:cofilin-2-like [Thalassophryne amazonica]